MGLIFGLGLSLVFAPLGLGRLVEDWMLHYALGFGLIVGLRATTQAEAPRVGLGRPGPGPRLYFTSMFHRQIATELE